MLISSPVRDGTTLLRLASAACLALITALGVLFWYIRRLRSELALARAQLQMVLDNMKEGLIVLNPDRTIALMNNAGSRLGAAPSPGLSYDVVQEQFEAFTTGGELLPPSEWPSARALRGDFVQHYAILYRDKKTGENGSRVIWTAPVPPGAGPPGQVVISYRDDSERLHVDLARERLASIVESCDDAIISTDAAGLITSWNRGAERMYGYTAAEILGSHIGRISPDDSVEPKVPHIPRLMRGETIEPFNAVRIAKDGRRLDIALSTFAVRNTTGEIIGTSGIARDITQTRALERQLSQSQKMEAIGQLTGGIAHDFNNLLAIVIGNLELMETLIADNRAAITRAHTARRAAARCVDLTQRLLAFSSREHLSPVATPLEHSVRNTVEMAIHGLGPEIEVAISAEPHMPPVFIDPAGFESALVNLVVNARDAMPRGGKLSIAVRTVHVDADHPLVLEGRLAPASYALVSIADQGHGMSHEVLERIFEPFYTTKERGRGTGLGLPMVYGFARQTGGTVVVESEPGQGTAVSLYLPFADVPAAPTAVARAARSRLKTGNTLLLVDDESELLEIACEYLTGLGFHTLQAGNAAQALQIAAQNSDIDLIITDILMPGGVNGFDLAQHIAKIRPALKVLFTSGFPTAELEQRGVSIHGNKLLRKPYRLAELHKAIQRALAAADTTTSSN
jgi:PAS domain S-box-containing protein